jgi:hypothetical protein
MLRRVRERHACFAGERVHRSFPLSKELEELEPMRVADRSSDACELRVEAILEEAVSGVRWQSNQVIS